MGKRKKRLRKQVEGLIKQAKKHEIKAETEKGRKDTTKDYWTGEAGRFRERAREREEMLKKLEGKADKEEETDKEDKLRE